MAACSAPGDLLCRETYYSTGGGFISREEDPVADNSRPVPHAFASGAELLAICIRESWRISDVMLTNKRRGGRKRRFGGGSMPSGKRCRRLSGTL
jgi:L-serine dehydratase